MYVPYHDRSRVIETNCGATNEFCLGRRVVMNRIDVSAEWIASGNRSHPNNLMIIDELRRTITYDRHQDDIDELERSHLECESEWIFNSILFKIKEKEKMYYGDRSHPRLVQLDSIRGGLSYDGWKQDFKAAEEEHTNDDEHGFHLYFQRLRRTQAIHEGDYSHEDLQYWYSLQLSYPDWENDFNDALETHKGGYTLGQEIKLRMIEKQKIHEGDRSHPHLVALDICSSFFTYPGWQKDVKDIENLHLDFLDHPQNEATDKISLLLKNLVRKQRKHETGVEDLTTMHPIQREIVETKWDYPGWERDVEDVRDGYHSSLFECELERCQLQQMIHEDNFNSHPALIELDALHLSYPDWEEDIEEAKTHLCKEGYSVWKESFDRKIQSMKNKQDIFDNKMDEDEDEECCICMVALMCYGEGGVKELTCGHKIHTRCLTEMSNHVGTVSHRRCPLCRAPMGGEELMQE